MKDIIILSRASALERGLPYFFTGIPCRNGHLSNRRSRDGCCVQCASDHYRRNYLQHREERIAAASKWWRDHHPTRDSKRIVTAGVIDRAQAKREGLRRYFTGIPCLNGHVSEHQTSNGICLRCAEEKRKTEQARNARKLRSSRARLRADPETERLNKRRRRAEHLDAYREQDRRWKLRNKARILAAQRKRRSDNREDYNERARAYYNKNRNVILAREKRYQKTPQGRLVTRALWSKRRALKQHAEITFSKDDLRKLKERQTRCYICLKPFTKRDPATIDHVIPLARGGQHTPGNIALAHNSCNMHKHARRTHLL